MVISKFLSLYLLMSIGFKGGLALFKTGFSIEFLYCLIGGLLLAVLVPVALFFIFKKIVSIADAAALAATYGSVSAVTFVAGTTWLEQRGHTFSGALIAVLAFMEAPAIAVGLLLHNKYATLTANVKTRSLVHEALFNGSVFLLLGSLAIGFITGPTGKESVGLFVIDLFKGLLGFFLLDLGIKSGQTLKRYRIPRRVLAMGIVTPMVAASLALAWSFMTGIRLEQAFLLMTLGAGASYIAVPAALKISLPQANAGLYLTMALGVIFPFNIIIGLPLYWSFARYVLG